jgi:hypothetical protein
MDRLQACIDSAVDADIGSDSEYVECTPFYNKKISFI